MAAYFPALPLLTQPPAVPSVAQQVLEHGKSLVTNGAPDRGIPPCSGCHGPELTGMQPAIPGLVGLKPAYISAQLGAWRYGTRTAAEPDCMQLVAGNLTEADVTAVASYLASLPVMQGAAPVPKGSLAMPLRWGSEPQLRRAVLRAALLGGPPMRGIAPCGAWHGSLDSKAGSEWLEGRPVAYPEAQLNAFRTGARHNDINGQMPNVARRMTPEEVREAARYSANRP